MSHLASTAETDDQYCDDIIGQSLTLAHNAVRSPPEQLLTSHILCQGSLDGPMPICNPVDDVCTRSCDPHGSCDQQYGSHDQHKSLDSSDVNKTSGTPEAAKPNPPITTVATSIPSKMSFIDWTEIKRKNVTPSDYPNTPTPVYIESGQDRRDPVMKIKKKKINTNPTVSVYAYVCYVHMNVYCV